MEVWSGGEQRVCGIVNVEVPGMNKHRAEDYLLLG
jgi:hypothetical protein